MRNVSDDQLWQRWRRLAGWSALVVGAPAQAVLQTFPLQHQYDVVTLIGDVDADGTRDLAIERYLGSSVGRRLDVYSLRTGTLLHQFAPPALQTYFEVARVGDIDGDGRDDIAHIEYRPSTAGYAGYTVVRSGLTGAYIHQFLWTTPGGLLTYGLDDVNGDGRAELLCSDSLAVVNGMQDAGRCDVIDGASGQVIRSHVGWFAGQGLGGGPVLGDIDRDGMRDYIVASPGHMRGHSGRTGAQVFHHLALTPSYGEYLTDIGDFNADGFDDIVFRDRGSYPFVVYEQTLVFAGPSMTQQLWSHTSWIQNPGPVHYYEHVGRLGDLDGDGHADIGLIGGIASIVSTVLSGRTALPLLEVGAGSPYMHTLYNHLDGPGDVDGDGIPDLLIRHWPTTTTQEVRLVSFAPPGVVAIGPGCANPVGSVPTIGVGTGARLGRTMTVNLSNAEPTLLAAVLGVGFSHQQWNSTPLPIDLGAYGLPGCFWRVAADVTMLVPTAGANGTRHHATHCVPVPQAPQLLGVALYWQWFVLEQSQFGATGSVTGAMRTTIVP